MFSLIRRAISRPWRPVPRCDTVAGMRRTPLLLIAALNACLATPVEGTSAGPESSTSTGSDPGPTSSMDPTTTPTGPTTTGPTSDVASNTSTDTGDASADTSGSADGTSAGDTRVTSDTSDTDVTSDTASGPLLVIEGLGSFATLCDNSDCAAEAACELVSGDVCEYVKYDCKLQGVGSYVPAKFFDFPQDFSFGLYALEDDDYGNICSCMKTRDNTNEEAEIVAKEFLQGLGLATNHTWCGLGYFYLVP